MEGLESIRTGRRPRRGLRTTEPEEPYRSSSGARPRVPGRPDDLVVADWFEVTPGRSLSFGPFDFDVLVFPAGTVAVEPATGAPETVDPNLALLCRRGAACSWTVPSAATVRCGLLTPGALQSLAAQGLPAAPFSGSPPDPVTIWTFPAPFYLAQKLVTGELPWRRPAPVPQPPEEAAGSPGWRLVVAWGRDGRRRGGSRLVRRVREHLAETLGAGERLREIAESLGYSEGHLSRSFKDELGVTIHAYRHELRMKVALDRLPFRSGQLSDLAMELGYASHSHFTARFLRTFGLTPSSCRRLLVSAGRVGR